MKAYLAEVLVIGFDDISSDHIEYHLKNSKHIGNASVITLRETDIGGWYDNHPLNIPQSRQDRTATVRSYFPE